MNPYPPRPLPTHWSPEQALAVYEYLQQLSAQLWHYYRSDFVAHLGKPATEVLQPTDPNRQMDLFESNPFDSDLPF